MDTPNDAIGRLAKEKVTPWISEKRDVRLVRSSLCIRAAGSKLQDSPVGNQWVDLFRVRGFGLRDASLRHVVIVYDLRPSFWVLNFHGKGEARRFASNEGVLDIQRIGFVTLTFLYASSVDFARPLNLEAVRRGGHAAMGIVY